MCNADVPLVVATANFEPVNFAISYSNSLTNLPTVDTKVDLTIRGEAIGTGERAMMMTMTVKVKVMKMRIILKIKITLLLWKKIQIKVLIIGENYMVDLEHKNKITEIKNIIRKHLVLSNQLLLA